MEIRKLPHGRKSAVLSFIRTLSNGEFKVTGEPCLLTTKVKSMLPLHGGVTEIIATGSESHGLLRDCTENAEITSRIDTHALSELTFPIDADEILNSQIWLRSGGVLTLQETEALTAIDVDTYAAHAQSRNALRARVNDDALAAIARLLRVRRIGGQIAIDFLPVPAPARPVFDQRVRAALAPLCPERISWAASGMLSFTLERTFPSLLEELTEPGSDDPVPGSRMRAVYRLALAVADLEDRLRRNPKSRFVFRLGYRVALLSAMINEARDKLVLKYGPRFDINDNPEPGAPEVEIHECP